MTGSERPTGEEALRSLWGPPVSAWRPADQRVDADSVRTTGSLGDALLAKCRENPDHDGFFDRVEDETALSAWLADPIPPRLELLIWATNALAYTYRVKDRDVGRARYWTAVEMRLARAFPADYTPADSVMGYGRDKRIAVALMGMADNEELEGAIAHAHDLLLEAERRLDAEDALRERLSIAERPLVERLLSVTGDRRDLYGRLAGTARQLGDPGAAQRYWNLSHKGGAIDREEDVPIAGVEIDALIQRGRFHLSREEPDRALSYFQRAVDIANTETLAQGAAENAGYAYRAMADAHRSLGNARSALALLDRAARLIEGKVNAMRLAGIHMSRARVFRDRPDLGDALEQYLRSLEYCGVPAGPGDEDTWEAADGKLLRIAAADRAWPILREVADYLEQSRRPGEAERFLRLATTVVERVRYGAFDEKSRMAVQNDRADAYVSLARVQLRLAAASLEERSTLVDEAWRTVETLRARSFLDVLGDAELTVPREVPAQLVRSEAALLDRRRLLRALPARDSGFWPEFRAVEEELAATWNAMASTTPAAREYVNVRQARPTPHSAMSSMLAGQSAGQEPDASSSRAVVVNLLFLDDDRLAFLAVGGGDEHVRVAVARVDRKRLTRFVAANFGSASRVYELAVDLEDLFHHEMAGVVAPLADLCDPGDTVVICPTGPLHHVPLGAVRCGPDVLLARNPLAVTPSASLLHSRRLAARERARSAHAVFGDPTGDLPHARLEAEELGELWGVPAHFGTAATGDAVLEALGSAGTVHMAAHARFSAPDPLASGLVMADRVLSAREILRARAPALDLVTLSACETGVYHADASEDVMGLTRALLFAGAGSVLVSLWTVADSSTRRLMTGFYAELRRGTAKAEALRRAALAARAEDARFDQWAGFVLMGAWA
ncbi:CHAT domain-containing protein [Streptomyces sp. ERV7]|uniref:CHAT domain-containing protein n=1 Tax=Streptomyces sp. ERV7 TaxID=1322334 RepID=UPI00131B61A5|nr:CHAT domain-containing tetratricopeptide repeat protein [Streptomyces sp. ERV7]